MGKYYFIYPWGFPPINPDQCASIGLKYLKDANFGFFSEELKIFLRIDSTANLV